jgi:hypothetical protein
MFELNNIIYLLIPIVFYSLSGVLDAVMDTLKDHYSISIFTKFNAKFWNPAYSWTNKYINNDKAQGHVKFKLFGISLDYPDALTDAWHIAKVFREFFNILAIISAIYLHSNVIEAIIFLSILGIIRNLCFNLFYNIILIKK